MTVTVAPFAYVGQLPMTVGRFGGMVPLGSGGAVEPEDEPEPDEPEPDEPLVLLLVEASSPCPPLELDWDPEEVPDGDPDDELEPEEVLPDEFKPGPVDPELDPVELPPSAPPVAVAPMAPLPGTSPPVPSSPWLGGLPAAHAEAKPSATKPIPTLHARIAPTG